MFWDGSYIGEIKERYISEIRKINGINYYHLNIPTIDPFWCLMMSSENKIPCVIDEISYLFGIVKMGTHSCTRLKKIYIMYRLNTMPLNKLSSILLPEKNKFSESKKLDIANIIIFRYICCTYNKYTTIILGNFIQTIFTNVNNSVFYKTSNDFSSIPQELFTEWIEDRTEDIANTLTAPINNVDDIVHIIERIDIDLLSYSDIIIERLYDIRMLYSA